MTKTVLTTIIASALSVETLVITALAKLQELKVKQVNLLKEAQQLLLAKDAKNIGQYNLAQEYARKVFIKVQKTLSDIDIKRTAKIQEEYDVLADKIKELGE